MNTRWISGIFIGLNLAFLCSSCIHGDDKLYSTHVFCFDKPTLDSLKKIGCNHVSCLITSIDDNGELVNEIYDDSSEVASGRWELHEEMRINCLLREGEKQVVGYKIIYMEGTERKYVGTEIHNWAGNLELKKGELGITQLRW